MSVIIHRKECENQNGILRFLFNQSETLYRNFVEATASSSKNTSYDASFAIGFDSDKYWICPAHVPAGENITVHLRILNSNIKMWSF